MATQRIYRIDGPENTVRLVRCSHPNLAVKHVADSLFTARVATQDDLEALLLKGVPVEKPQAEQLPLGD